MSEMSRACEIDKRTRRLVWDRDGHCCILCGNPQASANAHFIRRSHGGKGIRENVVTLCQKCHHDFDNGDKHEEYGKLIRDYLNGWYPNFPDERRVYDKYEWLHKEWNDD